MLAEHKKILFVVPTLFVQPNQTEACVSNIYRCMHGVDLKYKICVSINTWSEEFENFKFSADVHKTCGNKQFNIAKAINTAVYQNSDYDYFCYWDEGIRISRSNWIVEAISILEASNTVGLIGCRPHSTFTYFHRVVSESPLLFEVLWSDGILLCKMKTLMDNNLLEENYYADCELQDFGYRLHAAGFQNLFWKDLADEHVSLPFEKKILDPGLLLALRDESRRRFDKKWRTFEAGLGFRSFPEKRGRLNVLFRRIVKSAGMLKSRK